MIGRWLWVLEAAAAVGAVAAIAYFGWSGADWTTPFMVGVVTAVWGIYRVGLLLWLRDRPWMAAARQPDAAVPPELKAAVERVEAGRVEFTGRVWRAEIEFARESMLNAFPFRVETPALRVAQVVQARLLGRPDDSIDTWRDRVRALTAEHIRDAARRRLTLHDCAIVMVCTAADVRAKMEALPGVASVEVVPHDTP